MKIELRERTAGHVRVYFEQTQDEQIERMLPRSVESLEQALANFEATLLPGAASFGRTIYADGRYVGDVWCGAFTFADNKASIRVLEKNGFAVQESFVEDGRESVYLERGC